MKFHEACDEWLMVSSQLLPRTNVQEYHEEMSQATFSWNKVNSPARQSVVEFTAQFFMLMERHPKLKQTLN